MRAHQAVFPIETMARLFKVSLSALQSQIIGARLCNEGRLSCSEAGSLLLCILGGYRKGASRARLHRIGWPAGLPPHWNPRQRRLRSMASESRKTTKTIGLRLTPIEHELVLDAATSVGLGPSTFAREAILARASAPVSPRRRNRDALRIQVGNWTGQATRIGNDLNQLAKHASQGGRVDAGALDALHAEIRALHEAVLTVAGSSG